jgi:NTE family protein
VKTKARETKTREPPGQVVLVLQGGGALGAYQVGVFQALHEAGIEPDWVIGTSIGALNAAIIAGNRPEDRLPRLRELWRRFEQRNPFADFWTLLQGIPGFFSPRVPAWGGLQAKVGLDAASYYSTAPLRETLGFARRPGGARRGAPAAHGRRGEREERHDALLRQPRCGAGPRPSDGLGRAAAGFPAIRVDGEAYWDGGLYSNTPLEAVLDDRPRRDSLIFAVNVWQPTGHEPESLWEVLARQKDIQYASRADSHIARQKQIHRLRHVIRELEKKLSPEKRKDAECRELASWGCSTTMHVVRLLAPALDGEDYWKDLDFSAAGIRFRCEAGDADTRRMLERAPWEAPTDPMEGVIVHELSARTGG